MTALLGSVLFSTGATNVATASAACTSSRSTNTPDEATVVSMINQWRQQNGLSPLAATPALTRAAVSKSSDMASTGVFSHDDVMTTMARFSACGNNVTNVGENIAAGNADPGATFNQWKSSSEHNANMLSSGFQAMGVGHAVSSSGYSYWTTEFSNVVDSGSATGNLMPGFPTQPSLPISPVIPGSAPLGPGQGIFPGGGFVPSVPPPTSPTTGQGFFPGGFIAPSGGTAPVTSSGSLIGFGTLPATNSPGTGTSGGFGFFP
jgi:uncharacterized protein YkwD